MYPLQMIFGMTMTNFNMYLRFGTRIMVEIFRKDKLAKICLPSEEKIREYQKAIAERHPKLDGVWATIDGLKFTSSKHAMPRFKSGIITDGHTTIM